MGDINKVNYQYIKKWEGGLSSDPNDPAAAHRAPGSAYHTNMGITWATFSGLAPKLGYAATTANFLKMPETIWKKIYKYGYWDQVKADQINSQGIAELMADFAWGSGPGTAGLYLQRYLVGRGHAIGVDGAIGPQTINALNSRIKISGQKKVFDDLYAVRMAFLKSLPGWSIYGIGWGRRMQDFYNYGITALKNNILPALFFLGVAGGVAYYNRKAIAKLFK